MADIQAAAADIKMVLLAAITDLKDDMQDFVKHLDTVEEEGHDRDGAIFDLQQATQCLIDSVKSEDGRLR